MRLMTPHYRRPTAKKCTVIHSFSAHSDGLVNQVVSRSCYHWAVFQNEKIAAKANHTREDEMKDLAGHPSDADFVDRLIDQVVADPERVDDVKTLLRHKMAAPDALNVVEKPSVVAAPAAEDDVDDLWDNVPI